MADYLEQNIRVFDSRGTRVRTSGRKGSGPGEFRSVSGMARMPDRNVLVLDFASSRSEGDRMVAVTTDEDVVPSVVAFRIERPSH